MSALGSDRQGPKSCTIQLRCYLATDGLSGTGCPVVPDNALDVFSGCRLQGVRDLVEMDVELINEIAKDVKENTMQVSITWCVMSSCVCAPARLH